MLNPQSAAWTKTSFPYISSPLPLPLLLLLFFNCMHFQEGVTLSVIIQSRWGGGGLFARCFEFKELPFLFSTFSCVFLFCVL